MSDLFLLSEAHMRRKRVRKGSASLQCEFRSSQQGDDRCLLAPQILKGSATQKLATKLIGAGLAKEIKAKPGATVWRQDKL